MRHDPERVYQATLAQLKPALERVVKDPVFRERLEERPLEALREVGIQPDAALQAELTGKRFSEFWAARRAAVEGPVATRDLPPDEGSLRDEQLEGVAGGLSAFGLQGPAPNFAPPYVPVGPAGFTDEPVLTGLPSPNVLPDPLKRG
jgi:hypothetical protein